MPTFIFGQKTDAALRVKADIQDIIKAYPDKFAEGRSPQYVAQNFKKGLISMPMGMENGAPILALSDADYFYKRGIRYITLTRGKDNQICDSSVARLK